MIKRNNAPAIVVREAPFSHITEAGNCVYLAGIIAADDATNHQQEQGIKEETRICLNLVGALLNSVNLDYQHIASVLVHMTDLAEFIEMNKIYGQYFPENFQPVRTCVGVAQLIADAKIEITCIAHRPDAT